MLAWSELHPADLAKAEAAYRRNDLRTALPRPKATWHGGRSAGRRRCWSPDASVRLGEPDQAEAYYQKAGHLAVEDLHIRAYALVVNNRREPAIQAYRAILERRADDVLALSRLAAVLISESRWADALESADRLIKIPAGAVIGHTLAGVVHHNTRDSELAVFAFDRVVALDPELKQMPLKPRSMFWAEYGHNLLVVGRWQEARRDLSRRSTRRMTPRSPISSASRTISKATWTRPNTPGAWPCNGTRSATARGGGSASSTSSGVASRRRSSRSVARRRSSRERLDPFIASPWPTAASAVARSPIGSWSRSGAARRARRFPAAGHGRFARGDRRVDTVIDVIDLVCVNRVASERPSISFPRDVAS